MTYYLRRVKNKAAWDFEVFREFVERHDVPTDALGHLDTDHNCLSVWEIGTNQEDLIRVVEALATEREYLKPLEYILFSPDIPTRLGIEVRMTPVDRLLVKSVTGWHRDLVIPAGTKLLEFAATIFPDQKPARILEQDILKIIAQGIREDRIPRSFVSKLKDSDDRKKLERLLDSASGDLFPTSP